MEIHILNTSEYAKYENDILNMLIYADDEFVPPLSVRSSATQTNLKSTQKIDGGIVSYFEEIKNQKLMVATEDENVIGFVAFRENFTNEKITESNLPNIYISTLLVSPSARGKGLTPKMYSHLFKAYETSNVFTRTWSTNEAHIRILSKFGFETFSVLTNDRGEGVDTIYFKKLPEKR